MSTQDHLLYEEFKGNFLLSSDFEDEDIDEDVNRLLNKDLKKGKSKPKTKTGRKRKRTKDVEKNKQPPKKTRKKSKSQREPYLQTSIHDFSFNSSDSMSSSSIVVPKLNDPHSLKTYNNMDEIFDEIDSEPTDDFAEDFDDLMEPVEEYPWKPCQAPDIDDLKRTLGEPKPKSECFGCKHGGLNQAATSFDKWNILIKTFKDNYKNQDWIELARELEDLFEKQIRIPANKYKDSHKEAIPRWDASTIFFHFYSHIFDPSINTVKRIKQVSTMIDSHYKHSCWEVHKTDRNRKRVKTAKEKGDVDQFKIFKEMVMLEKSLLSYNPENSKFHNPSLAINAEFNASLINTNRPMYAKNVSSDIYKTRKEGYYDSNTRNNTYV